MLTKHFSQIDAAGWTPPTMIGKSTEDNPELDFPAGVFDSDIERYLDSVAESQQVDRAAAAVAVLAVIATAVQGKFLIRYPDSTGHLETLNLYCLIVASPSERKTTVSKLLMKPVYEWQNSKVESYGKLIAEYNAESKAADSDAAGAAKALKSSKKLEEADREELKNRIHAAEIKKANMKKPESPYHIFSDITPEALAKSLQECGEKGAIFNDEPDTLRIMTGLYNDGKVGNMGVYLKSYDGGVIDVRRSSGDAIHLKNPLMTMLVYGQPKIVDDILTNPELVGNGMISRFCLAYPKSMVEKRQAFVDVKPDTDAFNQFSTTIMDYLDMQNPERPKTLYFSEDAKRFLCEDGYVQYLWDLPKKGRPLQDHGEEAGKLPGNFMRICGLLHLLENPAHCKAFDSDADLTPISVDTVKRAIHISKYFVDTLIWFTNRSDSLDTSLLRKVFDAILDQTVYNGKAFTDVRSINIATRKTQGLKESRALYSILYQLQDAGLIYIDDQCTGTKRKLVFVNPLAVCAELGEAAPSSPKTSERWQ